MATYDDSFEPGIPLSIVAERQRGMSRSLGDLLKWRNGREGMDAWRAVTESRMSDFESEVRQIKRMLWGLIFTSLIGFGSVALAVYFSTHGAQP